jgi:hypothetical protein
VKESVTHRALSLILGSGNTAPLARWLMEYAVEHVDSQTLSKLLQGKFKVEPLAQKHALRKIDG